jgi:hypothetical protein
MLSRGCKENVYLLTGRVLRSYMGAILSDTGGPLLP